MKSEKNPPQDPSSSAEVDGKSRDLRGFESEVLTPYLQGKGDHEAPADERAARSLIPPLTATRRSFSAVASQFPQFIAEKCVACMECVIQCPDAAIYARANPEKDRDEALNRVEDATLKREISQRFVKTMKFWNVFEKKGQTPALFSLWIDPDQCKGCGECANVCAEHGALTMQAKSDEGLDVARKTMEFAKKALPQTPPPYINERLYTDLFLGEKGWIYKGGAGSCMGCGEITALKMALTATAAKYGRDMVIVAATGCNSVFSSTYPFNIFSVPWTNSLFENAPAVALGARMRLNQEGKKATKIWAVGGDGAMSDIGFQAASRALVSGEDINILVLDTQVYSNTGGQASSATFMGQSAKMSAHGKVARGKVERRKELGLIALMHPEVYVAQVSPAYYNHFLRAVLDAVDYPGPSMVIAYSPCLPEHGIADDMSFERSKEAVVSRAFPLFVYDPRKGKAIHERLDLRGNPSLSQDWHQDPKTGETHDFVKFARAEGRFAQHFDKEGNPGPALLAAQEDRAMNWQVLRELAGLK